MARAPFEEIVRQHGATVLRVCRALLEPTDADDAWSETFLSALRAYPELRPDSNVEAWLVTIAKHKVYDQQRRRRTRPIPVPELPVREATPSDEPDHSDLWQAVRALPRTQREAVTYHHIAGLPYAEVAGLLGNTEAAARRAAADGIKRLRTTYLPASATARDETLAP